MSIYLGDHIAFAEEFFEDNLNNFTRIGFLEKVCGTLATAQSDVQTRITTLQVHMTFGDRTINYPAYALYPVDGSDIAPCIGSAVRAYLLTPKGQRFVDWHHLIRWSHTSPVYLAIAENADTKSDFQVLNHVRYNSAMDALTETARALSRK